MSRRFYLIFGVILFSLVVSLFQLKHQVVILEKKLYQNQLMITKEKEALKVLKAEWSYLSDPNRIESLAERFLNLEIVNIKQIGDIEKIPFYIQKDIQEKK